MEEKDSTSQAITSILIIEDNPGDVLLVKEMIKLTGMPFKLEHAISLNSASSILDNKNVDIVLLDLGLPDSLGLETLARFREMNKKCPVVVMTGLDDQKIALEALRQGAQDYIVKNLLSPEVVLRTIQYNIERKKIQDFHIATANRFSVLSKATAALNECKDITSIFHVICNNFSGLLEGARAFGFEFPGSGALKITADDTLKVLAGKLKTFTGIDIGHSVVEMKSNSGLLKIFSTNTLTLFNEGLGIFFHGFVHGDKLKQLEHLLKAKHTYAVGLMQRKKCYGGFVILSEMTIGQDDVNIINAICIQTALNIHRRTIEKDLRKSEEQYRNLSSVLEMKVKERTTELETLNKLLHKELQVRVQAEKALKKSEEQLLELNATKDKFFNIVAHDLKNPFTSLLGSSELLYQNIQNFNSDNISRLALILNDSARSGYAILQNLLDWSRSQTGMLEIRPETFDLWKLVDEIIHDIELFSINKQIAVISEIEKDISIQADKNMTSTILRNLVSNAIKFSYRNAKIIIGANKAGKHVEVFVRDFGTGIGKSDISKLFRIDSRFSNRGTENEQGTGLGLKLCSEFVQKQGGRIWVESIENKGSCFYFTLSASNKPAY